MAEMANSGSVEMILDIIMMGGQKHWKICDEGESACTKM